MNSYKLVSLFLAVSLVVVCFQLSKRHQKVAEDDASLRSEICIEDSVLNTIMTRVSVRAYTDQEVEEDKIDNLLKAAMAAPTALNKQPWHFVVVKDKALLEELSHAHKYAALVAKAPLAIVVCGDMNKALDGESRDFWIQDCSAATENLLLAAHAQHLGAVWTGLYPGLEKCKAVSEVLNLPDHLVPLCMVVVGYPAESPQVKDKWREDNITYGRFEESSDDTDA